VCSCAGCSVFEFTYKAAGRVINENPNRRAARKPVLNRRAPEERVRARLAENRFGPVPRKAGRFADADHHGRFDQRQVLVDGYSRQHLDRTGGPPNDNRVNGSRVTETEMGAQVLAAVAVRTRNFPERLLAEPSHPTVSQRFPDAFASFR